MREKIMRALNASDLSHEEWECEVHVIGSMGLIQVRKKQQMTIGVLLLHIKAGHRRYIPHLLGILTAYVRSKAKQGRWVGVTLPNAFAIAQTALEHYLDPLCGVCNGTGKIGVFGKTIVLCNTANGGCGGSGKRAVRYEGYLGYVPYVLDKLGAWEGAASSQTAIKAGREPRRLTTV